MAFDVTTLAYIDETGYHYADYPTFLEELKQSYREIYGADIYLEDDSQDGQFISILAKAFYDSAALGASVFNSFSPTTAQGVGLSRNVQINGIMRRIPTFSTVDVDITGQEGTVIGITGSPGIAQDTLDQKWNIPIGTTIPGSGTILVTATAQAAGSVAAEANTVNKIFTPTLGWQTVNNALAATPGVPVESDAELRSRQAQSTANPSLTVLDGTLGAIANVDGVTRVRGYENDTNTTDANGLLPHSIQCEVVGGDVEEIAQTIALHKTPGTSTQGNTSQLVYDTNGMPLLIKFDRPTEAIISVEITIAAQVGWTTEFEPLIAQAVADQINSLGIGNDVLLTRIYVPAYLIGTTASETYDIVLIRLKKNAGAFLAANVDIEFDEYPSCDPDTDFTFIIT